MDGTLVDTEQLWWQAAEEEAARLGHRLGDADVPEVLGRAVGHTAAHLHRVTGGDQPAGLIGERLDARFTALVSAGLRPLPGALALLDALAADGVPLGLVSASPRSVVDLVLGRLGGSRFAVTVAAGETPRTKPAPDPYLAAARRLGAAPGGCVAVEDTPTGVASAEAAGCRVLAVPSLAPIPPAAGRAVVRSLSDADPALLHALATR
ncbi:HAD family phosphatase [Streptomyces sp. RB6PN25]|uniref:HAD family phosphatase n=2 Tax=Streptomyces humicola TaxID=2953240 RepID=A0ABT1PRS4_9ACTN|nr:HAD family phosphatase [Streptomyces humicola]